MSDGVVAASAGNSGPTTSTVAHPSPWTTTVAAGTHNRNGAGSVTLGNGMTYSGASFAGRTGPAPLVGADLEVMRSDTRRMRGDRPFVFTNMKTQVGVDTIADFIVQAGGLGALNSRRHSS